MIRVLIVDDHSIVRQGLRFVLDHEEGIAVVGEAANGNQALAMTRALSPDVILLDLIIPEPDGLAVLATVHVEQPSAGVVILSSSPEDNHVVEALRGGALSYLSKTAGVDEITDAVRAAARGEGVLSSGAAARLMRVTRQGVGHATNAPLDLLSPRERDVLTELSRGRSNREIARSLRIGEETVKTHVSSVLAKLGVADRTQAAIVGLQHKLVPLDSALDSDG
jgi:two-component system, NarL family, response regulator LiaR